MDGLDLVFSDYIKYTQLQKTRENSIIKILREQGGWNNNQIFILMKIRKLYIDMCNLIENDDIFNILYSYFGTDLIIINNRSITKEELLNIGFSFVYLIAPKSIKQ